MRGRVIFLFMKEPECKICGGPHYKTFCRLAPRKPIPVYKPLRVSVTPINRGTYKFTNKPRKPLKRTPIASQSKSERSKLIREADKVFSVYVRRRHAIGNKARCVTCGTVNHWKSFHNGHFISRRKLATRYNEMNCNVQCSHCNTVLGGNLKKYEAYLIQVYGYNKVEELKLLARVGAKLTDSDLRTIIEKYKPMLDS